MIRLLLVLALICVPALAPAVAAGEAPTVRLEIDAPAEPWIGQDVPVTLRVLIDLGAFEAASVQLFPRAMDLQLKLTAPWADAAPEAPPAGADTLSLVLNDSVVALRRAPDREGLAVLEALWTLAPEEAGPLDLPAPTFEFAWAEEFEDDFVSGRRPVDPRKVRGTGEAMKVEVRTLPGEGRPEGFFGAVGRFIVLATVEPGEVAVGQELTLTLKIQGEGNLTRFGTPTVAPDGFHVLGRIDDRASPVRTIRYDLTPVRGGLEAFPSLPFPFFDPETGRYAAGATAPIPLVVAGAGPEEGFVLDEGESGFPWSVALAVVAVLIGLVVLVVRMRRKPAEPEGPSPAVTFHERVETDVISALTGYLASALGCPPAAVISPDLADRLAAAGVRRDLADRAGALVADLVGARYGGESGGDERHAARDLVNEIEAAG